MRQTSTKILAKCEEKFGTGVPGTVGNVHKEGKGIPKHDFVISHLDPRMLNNLKNPTISGLIKK